MTSPSEENASKSVFFDEEISGQLFEIIKGATESVIFVTPYVRLWEHLKSAISKAVERDVDVTFVIREEQNHRQQEDLRRFNDDMKWLREHEVNLYQIPNLHAKIYLNEHSILVSSMNTQRTSKDDSKEFAMLVRNDVDGEMIRTYVSEFLPKTQSQSGHCIRCGTEIPYDTEKPFCPQDWRAWNKYHNYKYEEKYCLSCGKKAKTTINKPLCVGCWSKSN